MDLSIIGTGHVGLVSGVCFADMGHRVVCIDNDKDKIQLLNAGKATIFEPGLPEMLAANRDRLTFSTDMADATASAEAIFVAVGTPARENGRSDLSYVTEAVSRLAPHLKAGQVVAMMSTVPVGTSRLVREIIDTNVPAGVDPKEVYVASNPEFLREGRAVYDRLHPTRIVVGVDDERAAEILKRAFDGLEAPFYVTNCPTAEITKYASNAFLATKISFINEIARLCELVGADVTEVSHYMGDDPRIGRQFLQAGLGYGGSCFPKDTKALDQIAFSQGHNFTLLKAVIDVNNMQRVRFVHKIASALGDDLKGKTIALLGISFKPDTDDVREAPSIEIISRLLDARARIRAYDPVAMPKVRGLFPTVTFCEDAYEAAAGSDVVAVITDWPEFKDLDMKRLTSVMAGRVLVDGRNIFDPKAVAASGLTYHGVGR